MTQATQTKALAALVEHGSITKAAEAANISRPTIYRLLDDKCFRQRLEQMRAAMAIQRSDELADARKAAIQAIVAVMNDESAPPAARVMAAKAVLIQAAEADAAADSTLQKLDFDSRWT